MKYLQYIKEYLQQADKIYFKPNLLSEDEKKIILNITHSDEYTRLLSDWYYHMKKHLFKDKSEDKYFNSYLHDFYKNLKEYKSDIFPIGSIENMFSDNAKIYKRNLQDFSYFTKDNGLHVFNLFCILRNRHLLITEYNKLPNLAKRNIKEKSETIHNENIAKDYYEKLVHINKLLSNMPAKIKDKAMKKAFTSKNDLKKIENIIQVFSYGVTSIDSDDFDIDDFVANISDDLDVDIIQHDKNVLVLKINSQDAMSYIANLSNWCFIYDSGYWEQYSGRDGYIYLIIDLNFDISNARFMLCLVESGDVYVSTNVPLNDLEEFQDNPIDDNVYLQSIGVDLKLIK